MEYFNKAYLLIGGNVGNKFPNLERAMTLLQKQCGDITSRSSFYETAPWGNTEQASFLNLALELHTKLTAINLMLRLLETEKEMGRIRQEKYGPRIIDLDILLFNDEVVHTPELTIPHKELQNRRFVLEPLTEIAALIIHPVFNKTIQQLLDECTDHSEVTRLAEKDKLL